MATALLARRITRLVVVCAVVAMLRLLTHGVVLHLLARPRGATHVAWMSRCSCRCRCLRVATRLAVVCVGLFALLQHAHQLAVALHDAQLALGDHAPVRKSHLLGFVHRALVADLYALIGRGALITARIATVARDATSQLAGLFFREKYGLADGAAGAAAITLLLFLLLVIVFLLLLLHFLLFGLVVVVDGRLEPLGFVVHNALAARGATLRSHRFLVIVRCGSIVLRLVLSFDISVGVIVIILHRNALSTAQLGHRYAQLLLLKSTMGRRAKAT